MAAMLAVLVPVALPKQRHHHHHHHSCLIKPPLLRRTVTFSSSSPPPPPTTTMVVEEEEDGVVSAQAQVATTTTTTSRTDDPNFRGCKACGKPEIEKNCNGEGRIQGGIATVPGFGWWPIKAYRPCPGFTASGGRYRRYGQSMDEVVSGRGKRDASA